MLCFKVSVVLSVSLVLIKSKSMKYLKIKHVSSYILSFSLKYIVILGLIKLVYILTWCLCTVEDLIHLKVLEIAFYNNVQFSHKFFIKLLLLTINKWKHKKAIHQIILDIIRNYFSRERSSHKSLHNKWNIAYIGMHVLIKIATKVNFSPFFLRWSFYKSFL